MRELTDVHYQAIVNARVNEVDRVFLALADPTRRKVVDILRRGPKRAGDLAASFKVTAPAMSRHLRVLRKSGIIEEDRARGLDDDARVRMYRLRREPFVGLRGWLDEVESFWGDQLAAFKAHAERGSGKRS
jgi:DNA-binding transcriptional ArsR family regulator